MALAVGVTQWGGDPHSVLMCERELGWLWDPALRLEPDPALPLEPDPALAEANERFSPALLAPDQQFSRL